MRIHFVSKRFHDRGRTIRVLLPILVLAASHAAADGSVPVGAARQRYPWNGLVDVSFELEDRSFDTTAVDPDGVTTHRIRPWRHEVSFAASDTATGAALPVSPTNVATRDGATGDPSFLFRPGATGVVWNADADVPEAVIANVAFAVSAEPRPPLPPPEPLLYAIVDLSGGPDAASYPVTMTNEMPAGGFNTNEYKTTKLVLRRVDPGSFEMGSPTNTWNKRSKLVKEEEKGRHPDEYQHAATLTQPFYLALFELTQEQWALVTGSGPERYAGGMRPVENVSYDDIRGRSAGAGWPATDDVDETSFMGRLRRKTAGCLWDLPTEAQWEYACRAGTTTALNTGMDLTNATTDASLAAAGRYYHDRGDGNGGFGEHTAVGSYRPNAWGFHDMHGNVKEWCLDNYRESLGGASAIDPAGPAAGPLGRSVRGGGWGSLAEDCRSANREFHPASARDPYTGFRPSFVILSEEMLPTGSVETAFSLDTRTGVRPATNGIETLVCDSAWFGDEITNLVVEADDGRLVFATTDLPASGLLAWNPDVAWEGIRTLSLLTNGVAAETARFLVPSRRNHCETNGDGLPAGGGLPVEWRKDCGDAAWFRVVEEGGDETGFLRSGEIGSGETSSLAVVDLVGPGRLEFDWRVSCNPHGDSAACFVGRWLVWSDGCGTATNELADETECFRITGTNDVWRHESVDLGAGTNSVRWSYIRGTGSPDGGDRACLDNVVWRPCVTLSVTSLVDRCLPAAGDHAFLWGDSVGATNEETVVLGNERVVCTGWTGTGSVPAEGDGPAVSFTITNDSALVWTWRRDVNVEVAGRGPLWPAGTNLWVTCGSTNVLALGPTAGYTSWSVEAADPETSNLFGVADCTNLWEDAGPFDFVSSDTSRPAFHTNELHDVAVDPVGTNLAFRVLGGCRISVRATAMTLPSALDTTGLVWRTSGAGGWFPQELAAANGASAAKSGPALGDEKSFLRTRVEGAGTFSWTHRLERAAGGNTGLHVYLDGGLVFDFADAGAWERHDLAVAGNGPHEIAFEFWNAGSEETVSDCAYLDAVVWSGFSPVRILETGGSGVPVGWTGGGDADWFAVVEEGGDETGFVRSGEIGCNETSWLAVTNVAGPGRIVFDWRVSCNEDGDGARFLVDGTAVTNIAGTTDWETVDCDIGLGGHVLQWVYERGTNAPAGEDRACLDNVAWKPCLALAVTSAVDRCEPAPGVYADRWILEDAVVATNEGTVVLGNERVVCTGWTGTGSVPAEGDGPAVSFTITNDSSLVWNWRRDVRADVSCEGPVRLASEIPWTTVGATNVLAVEPLADYVSWSLRAEDLDTTDVYGLDAGASLGPSAFGGVRASDTSRAAFLENALHDIALDPNGTNLAFRLLGGCRITLVATAMTLETALDATNLVWQSEGAGRWFPQDVVAADGVSAAKGGAAPGGGTGVLRTRVEGAGTFAWTWKLAAEGAAAVDLLLDGTRVDGLDAETGWTTGSLAVVGSGTHEIAFEFRNAGTVPSDCAYVDQTSWDGSVGDATALTPVPVPYAWLDGFLLGDGTAAGYETAAAATAANGINTVWECYVAGLDPTNALSTFFADVDASRDPVVVTWSPDLGATRAYVVEGKTNLVDQSWGPTNESTRFYRVKVSMP